MTHGERLIRMKALMVDDELAEQTANGRAARALVRELRDRDVIVVEATSPKPGQPKDQVQDSGTEAVQQVILAQKRTPLGTLLLCKLQYYL
jgi:hypothetical protein